MGHQITKEELNSAVFNTILASSTRDKKKLILSNLIKISNKIVYNETNFKVSKDDKVIHTGLSLDEAVAVYNTL